jgi:hypothetical protein
MRSHLQEAIPKHTAHVDPSRGHCWRRSCREQYGIYRPVIFESGGRIKALCHHADYRLADFDLRVELWRHLGDSEASEQVPRTAA